MKIPFGSLQRLSKALLHGLSLYSRSSGGFLTSLGEDDPRLMRGNTRGPVQQWKLPTASQQQKLPTAFQHQRSNIFQLRNLITTNGISCPTSFVLLFFPPPLLLADPLFLSKLFHPPPLLANLLLFFSNSIPLPLFLSSFLPVFHSPSPLLPLHTSAFSFPTFCRNSPSSVTPPFRGLSRVAYSLCPLFLFPGSSESSSLLLLRPSASSLLPPSGTDAFPTCPLQPASFLSSNVSPGFLSSLLSSVLLTEPSSARYLPTSARPYSPSRGFDSVPSSSCLSRWH